MGYYAASGLVICLFSNLIVRNVLFVAFHFLLDFALPLRLQHNIRITWIHQIYTGLEKMTAQCLADGAWLANQKLTRTTES
jgi:hypothetical protein